MSKLRSEELEKADRTDPCALPYDTALYLIYNAVARRRSLIHGRLRASGKYCAIGAFWADNPKTILRSSLIDEVAAVNDSLPQTATPFQRWKTVVRWLRWKLKVLEQGKKP